jgi:hypothetical protein
MGPSQEMSVSLRLVLTNVQMAHVCVIQNTHGALASGRRMSSMCQMSVRIVPLAARPLLEVNSKPMVHP